MPSNTLEVFATCAEQQFRSVSREQKIVQKYENSQCGIMARVLEYKGKNLA